jgi:hypothetical protein
MNDEQGKVSELNDELYSRTRYHAPEDKRTPIDIVEEPNEVGKDFQSPKLEELLAHERIQSTQHPMVKRIFIIALVFCILTGGVAAFIYLDGGNFISSKNVDIAVNGPVSVSAGDPIDLSIVVTNTNNADLQLVNMSVDYPDGTRDASNVNTALTHDKIAIGSIGQGKSVTEAQHPVLFGQTGDIKQINITVDYQIKGSNATFNKTKVYQVAIGTTPVGLTVDQPNSVTSGDTFSTTLTIVSNSTNVLKNVVIRGEYPYGYSVNSTTPTSATTDNNTWILGDLAPGDKRTVIIKGVLVGENQDERTFRFYAGIASADNPSQFDTSLAETSKTLSLNRPNIGLKINLNGENSDSYVAPLGKSLQGTISFQNNLPSTLTNSKIVVKLSGASLDRFSILAQSGGFYNSADNSITWTKDNNNTLTALAPGDTGNVSFTFASLASLPTGTRNPQLGISATFVGTPQGGSSVTVSDNSFVKIASQVSLTSVALYSKGPFKNYGTLPPKSEKPTTYTVTFSLGNTQNDINTPVVTATLGPNVTWMSAATSTEDIKYNPNNNTVTWGLQKLASGVGFTSPIRTVSFQVLLKASIGQIGSIPTLVNNISFSGVDSFTNKPVNLTNQSVNTTISSDPRFVQGDDAVVK